MAINSLYFGNWKMNMRSSETAAFAERFLKLYKPNPDGVADVGFAPPYTSLAAARESFKSQPGILLGAQSAHWLESGAHTGEISVAMLQELKVQFVILGHSERRQFYGENNSDVARRAKAVIAKGLTAVVCIGETKTEFEAGKTGEVVDTQLSGSLAGISSDETAKLVIAYEPVWAIGTGLAATPEIAAGVHNRIRGKLKAAFGEQAGGSIAILYGGSTTPQNIAELVSQENVNGALVGGTSLKPDAFFELIQNGRQVK